MKKILLCDDAPTVLKLMEMILSAEGYKIEKSSNANEAVDTIKQKGPFDLGIFDVNMPGKSGIELAADIQNLPEAKGMKVMIVSTESSYHLKEAGKQAGVKAWLTKPYDDGDLVEVVGKLLS
ncbi:MAG: response regulator [Leptospiraceae bacterium]|jgi:two-component system chemotaxis response regulator CheY|nr:response regulator [Leptospiraceae bacterium]